eukprot:scaffold44947_cov81-Cyclotella_meneghiniana.AAC.2
MYDLTPNRAEIRERCAKKRVQSIQDDIVMICVITNMLPLKEQYADMVMVDEPFRRKLSDVVMAPRLAT